MQCTDISKTCLFNLALNLTMHAPHYVSLKSLKNEAQELLYNVEWQTVK